MHKYHFYESHIFHIKMCLNLEGEHERIYLEQTPDYAVTGAG